MKLNINLGIRSFWRGLRLEDKYHFLLLLLVLCPFFLPLTRAVFIRIGLRDITSFSDYVFWTFAILGYIKRFIRELRWSDILVTGGIVLFFFISPNIYPQSTSYCAEHGDFFVFSCIPLYFVGRTIDLYKDSQKLVWISRISIFINYVYLFALGASMLRNSEGSDEMYNMSMSYRALLPVLIIIWNAMEKRRIWDYIFTMIGMFLILSLGTRGPLVCLLFFIVGYLFFFKKYKNNFLIKSSLLSIFILLYSFVGHIIIFLREISVMLGVSTRIYDSFIDNAFINYEDSNGRNFLHEIIIKKIQEDNDGFGYGFFGDRQFTPAGEYCHNFELELLVSFGKYGGGIILMILFIFIYKTFKKTYGSPACSLLFAFFCATFMQLQFTGSYTTTPWFWLYLGLFPIILRGRNKRLIR